MTAHPNPEPSRLVLLVDDDPIVRATLSLILNGAGYQTICAEDGDVAQQLIRDRRPDVIVTDIFMPKQDGFGLMNWLRRQGVQIPVVAISGRSCAAEFDGLGLARRLGAVSVLEKPFSTRDLTAAVGTALAA
ncbi:MAG TPA: response regulator [Candidatus Cybelea sp.]|nr:response regulator [Candidatus Cybelea sp.]